MELINGGTPLEERMRRTDFSTIIPSLAPEAIDPELDQLLSPARHEKYPGDVLRDATLELSEKRATLESGTSDAYAVASMPALSRPPVTPQPITFDAIKNPLRRLDRCGSRIEEGVEVGRHP